MALTDAQEKQVIDFLTDPAKALKLGDLVTSAVGQATTTLSKTVEEIAGTVKKLGEAAPAPKPDDKAGGKPKTGTDDDQPPAWAKAIIESTKKAEERFTAMDAEKTKAGETATREALIAKTLTDEKYSGLTKHKTFVRDLHARGVKTADEVKAALADFIADQKALGVDIKPGSASPEKEGAKGAGGAGGGGGEVKPLAERIESIKRISAEAQAKPVGS